MPMRGVTPTKQTSVPAGVARRSPRRTTRAACPWLVADAPLAHTPVREHHGGRAMQGHSAAPDWSKIPAPTDDGGARHLPGSRVPPVPLPATDGSTVDLSALPGRVVVYAYPRTGPADGANPEGWD